MRLIIHFKLPIVVLILISLIKLNFLTSTTALCAQEDFGDILVGVPADFPPQYSIDEETGELAGFAINIMNAVANMQC